MFNLERIYQAADDAKSAGLIERFADGVKRIAPYEFQENPDCPLLYTLEEVLKAACNDRDVMHSLTRKLPEILDRRSKRWGINI